MYLLYYRNNEPSGLQWQWVGLFFNWPGWPSQGRPVQRFIHSS